MKGKALRRALAADPSRIAGDVPLIQDTTELITPDVAYEMLTRNKNNRPINWKRVEEYSAAMARGEWILHAQGIVLDVSSNVVTGQKRLWAVIYSGASVWMRVSRGNPKDSARLIDRHDPQSARDLATRVTGRKHRPIEASIARGMLALDGVLRPSRDDLAAKIESMTERFSALLRETAGTKKTRAVVMVLAAIASIARDDQHSHGLVLAVDFLAASLESSLHPMTAQSCWGHGAAFVLAMTKARELCTRTQT